MAVWWLVFRSSPYIHQDSLVQCLVQFPVIQNVAVGIVAKSAIYDCYDLLLLCYAETKIWTFLSCLPENICRRPSDNEADNDNAPVYYSDNTAVEIHVVSAAFSTICLMSMPRLYYEHDVHDSATENENWCTTQQAGRNFGLKIGETNLKVWWLRVWGSVLSSPAGSGAEPGWNSLRASWFCQFWSVMHEHYLILICATN